MLHKKQLTEFTIVELLIVIVVIGILAAITIVSFNGIQAKAKAAQVKTTASTILKKVKLYRTLSGDRVNGYPIPDQASQWWNIQSDLSSNNPAMQLPSNLRIFRGRDNSSDTAGSDCGSISVVWLRSGTCA